MRLAAALGALQHRAAEEEHQTLGISNDVCEICMRKRPLLSTVFGFKK
eukprot:COSAG06_NODE_18454_length_887_cov_0.752538_1_plen_47_part_10